jgi:hypothetical protein
MANNTSSNEQGQPGAPLTLHESHVLDDIGKWLGKEDPALAGMLGAARPTPRGWPGGVTTLRYVLACVVLPSLLVYLGFWLTRFAFSPAVAVEEFAVVLGSVGLTALVFLWLPFLEAKVNADSVQPCGSSGIVSGERDPAALVVGWVWLGLAGF